MSSPGGALADLQNFASNTASMDDIISLDINDLGTSGNTTNLDMSLLANHKKTSNSPKTPGADTGISAMPYSSSGSTFQISNPPPDRSGLTSTSGIDFVNIEDTQKTVSFNPTPGTGLAGVDTIHINRTSGLSFVDDIKPIDLGSSVFGDSTSKSNTIATPAPPSPPVVKITPEQEATEKAAVLNKIRRLATKGIEGNRLNMTNSLEEIKAEYARLVDSRNLESSIKFQRNALLTAVTGMEFLNQRFNPIDVNLDGWSESVNENAEDFDEIFEELYDKYKDRSKMAPEVRLIMTLGISATMCHVTNSFFKSKMPGMDDILKRNPDLARQFAQAAAQQSVGPGFANFMSMGSPGGSAPPPMAANDSRNSMNEPQHYSEPNMGGNWRPDTAPSPGPSTPQVQTARREMRGPSGVEDILKAFEEEDRSAAVNVGFTPPPKADMNDENQSVFTSTSLGGGSEAIARRAARGGRRKVAAAPAGATIDLNV